MHGATTRETVIWGTAEDSLNYRDLKTVVLTSVARVNKLVLLLKNPLQIM